MSVREAFRDPRGYVVRTVGMYRSLLFDPDSFYDESVGSRGIWLEVLVVAVVGALGLVGNIYMYDQLTLAFEEANVTIDADTNFNLVGNVLAPLVGAYLLWFAFSGGLYLVGWLYSTMGQFFGVMKRAAWALVPIAIHNVLLSAVKLFSAFQYAEEDAEGLQVPRPSDQKAEFIWAEIAGEPVVLATVAVGVIFAVWAGYVGAYGVADERELEPSEGLRVAAVPAGAYAVYLVYVAATGIL